MSIFYKENNCVNCIYYCWAASEVIFMTCDVFFILQCDKKEMRKNYMQTKRFKVSNSGLGGCCAD